MRSIFSFLLLCIPVLTFCQRGIDPHGFKGNVRTVTERTLKYVDPEQEGAVDGMYCSWVAITRYDRQGRMSVREFFAENNIPFYKEVPVKNTAGDIIGMISSFFSGDVIEKEMYTFISDTTIVSERFDPDEEKTHTLTLKREIRDGRVVKETATVTFEDSTSYRNTSYTEYEMEYTYDNEGNVIYLSRTVPQGKTAYTYSYADRDEQGNWTRQVSYIEGEPCQVVITEFEYYD